MSPAITQATKRPRDENFPVASLLLLMSAVAADRAPLRQPGVLGRTVAFVGRNTFAIYVANVAMLEVSKATGFTAFAVSGG